MEVIPEQKVESVEIVEEAKEELKKNPEVKEISLKSEEVLLPI